MLDEPPATNMTPLTLLMTPVVPAARTSTPGWEGSPIWIVPELTSVPLPLCPMDRTAEVEPATINVSLTLTCRESMPALPVSFTTELKDGLPSMRTWDPDFGIVLPDQ